MSVLRSDVCQPDVRYCYMPMFGPTPRQCEASIMNKRAAVVYFIFTFYLMVCRLKLDQEKVIQVFKIYRISLLVLLYTEQFFGGFVDFNYFVYIFLKPNTKKTVYKYTF